MTYLVSYCVYTAATINVQEIKSSDASVSQAAAMRLSVSLKVLESEAQQTPGVRRSIDIIKRQLRSFSAHPHQRAQQQPRPINNGVASAPEMSPNVYTTVPTDPTLAPATIPPPDHEPSPLSSAGEMEFIDTGGGFQPEALNWTLQDTLMASPSFEEFSWVGAEHAGWASHGTIPQHHQYQ